MALSKGFPFFPPSLVLSTILSNFSNVAFLRELSFMFVVHLSPTPLDQVGKTWRWNLGRCRPNWPLPRSPRRKIQKPRNWNLFSLPPPLTPKISTPSHSHPTTNSSLPHLRTKPVNTKQSYAGFYSMYRVFHANTPITNWRFSAPRHDNWFLKSDLNSPWAPILLSETVMVSFQVVNLS